MAAAEQVDSAAAADVIFELPDVLRIYSDGRIERLSSPAATMVPAGLDPATNTASKDVIIDPAALIGARLYLPESEPDSKLPLLVYFHGGGFMFGSTADGPTHAFLNSLATRAKIVIVSVEYRLAPENPIPAPYDDAWAAFQWAVAGGAGDEWVSARADLGRVFLAGESAGANIAHNIAMRAGPARPVEGAALVQPLFWGSERVGWEADPDPSRVLQPEQLDAGWRVVAGQEAELDDPRLNPLAEEAPALVGLGCRRVLVCVAGKDLLRERGRAYFERLSGGGGGWVGTAEMVVSEEEDHGFHLEKPGEERAAELMERLVRFFQGDKN